MVTVPIKWKFIKLCDTIIGDCCLCTVKETQCCSWGLYGDRGRAGNW